MKYKIGVFGSAVQEKGDTVEKAKTLGKFLIDCKDFLLVITGACSGIPYQVAFEAAKGGVEVWGYSPVTNIKGQKEFTPKDDLSIYQKIIYTPRSFEFSESLDISKKYRNVVSTANCDAGIIISGRWGTMNEFTNLYDMGKIIGILTGTGGVADELPGLAKKISKESKAKVLFDDSPEKLVEDIIQEFKAHSI